MNRTSIIIWIFVSIILAGSCFAETITIDFAGWSDPSPIGLQTVSWSFDLSGSGLDAPGVIVNSAILEIWATSVDASIPPDFWDGNKHYHYYQGSDLADLSDPIYVECATFPISSLIEGDGVTTIPLLDELSDGYSYLRDGTFDVSILIYETDSWWDILDYSYSGNYFYLRRPRWDGSLTLINSRLTIEYDIEPTILSVVIDIKPGSYPNSINIGSQGLIPVAILSSYDFDATFVNPETIELSGLNVAAKGKTNRFMAHQEDVNEDGLIDLVVQVETSNFDPGSLQDGYALLVGETYDGYIIAGLDEITIVPTK